MAYGENISNPYMHMPVLWLEMLSTYEPMLNIYDTPTLLFYFWRMISN